MQLFSWMDSFASCRFSRNNLQQLKLHIYNYYNPLFFEFVFIEVQIQHNTWGNLLLKTIFKKKICSTSEFLSTRSRLDSHNWEHFWWHCHSPGIVSTNKDTTGPDKHRNMSPWSYRGISPGQKLGHVFFAHPTKHFELLQVAHMSLLIFPKGDALNNCWPFQF